MSPHNFILQFAFLYAPLLHMHFTIEQVSPVLYRGLDPSAHEIQLIHDKGIKTIVSMRTKPERKKEALCKKLGMNWIHIPTGVLSTPKPEQFDQFLSVFNDPAKLPVYACCTIDMERSAAYVEAYRMKDQHWTSELVHDEFTKHHLKRWWPPFNHYQGVIEKYANAGETQSASQETISKSAEQSTTETLDKNSHS
jgi:protein tyrosine phosphatase (PTP) superfamily phosphohydrolase (DUF442 family)